MKFEEIPSAMYLISTFWKLVVTRSYWTRKLIKLKLHYKGKAFYISI